MNKRRKAELRLALIDAEVAYWFVNDGQLSEEPLEGKLSENGRRLRELRLKAVARLERHGGHDPAPALLRPPTEAQRRGYAERRRW